MNSSQNFANSKSLFRRKLSSLTLMRQKGSNLEGLIGKSNQSIVNLQNIVLNYAYDWYKANDKKYVKCRFGRKVAKWANLVHEIDWSGLRVSHEEVTSVDQIISLESGGKPANYMNSSPPSVTHLSSVHKVKKLQHVLFRSQFVNDTNKDQSYNLKAERRTVAKCKISLDEGYKVEIGSSAALCVPLPNCVIKSSANLKTEYSMEDKVERDIEEELRWSAESVVKVPSMSVTTAELIVDEDEYDGDFQIRSTFKGEIRVLLKHPDTGKLILEMRFRDLSDVFTSQLGFHSIPGAQAVCKISRGHCKARFGVDQKIELHQKPLGQV